MAKLSVAKNWKPARVFSKNEWLFKCHYVVLMDKVSAINYLKAGQINALSSLTSIWIKYIDYWNNTGTFNSIQQQILDLL